MASDDFDFDWGDDPFGGDLDFDSDFGDKKKGKIHSFATGFLSGLKSNTIGDTDARIKTARSILPSSFAGVFDTATEMNKMRKTVLDDIKSESADSIKDAQFLVGQATDKFRKFIPNRIAESALEFSQRDFSDWDKSTSSSSQSIAGVGEASDDELKRLIEDTRSSNLQNNNMLYGMGNAITETIGQSGARTNANLIGVNQGIGRSNVLLKQVVDYQRKIQARNDALKINLLARMHITNAKFYKFVEASNHKMIDELKGINKNSALSDYQKTSTSQAARKAIRGNFFNTTMSKAGGIMGYFKDTMGKDARDDLIGGMGGMLSEARMASEMSQGMGLDMTKMAGEMLAGAFIEKLPQLIRGPGGKKLLDKFVKMQPEKAAWAKEQYKKLEEIGNVASYSMSNAEGIANTMAKHYKGGFDENQYNDYTDYFDKTTEAGGKPMKRAAWEVLNKAKGIANKTMGGVLDNTYLGQGRQINLSQRNIKDSMEPSIWNRQSERALTEIIPQWLSNIHLSIEKMRTGNDELKSETYDYTKGKFVSHADNIKSISNQLFNRNQFSSQAYMASSLAGSVDKGNALSKEAKDALSLQLAKQSDGGFGFSPYNFMNLEQEGVNKKHANEIKAMMMANFGIKDEHLTTFNEGSDTDRAKLLMKLPSAEGNALANNVVNSAKSLGRFTPDITEMIDVLRNTGQYGAMKDAGVIKSTDGVDSVDMGRFWDTLGGAISDPNGRPANLPSEDGQRGRTTRRMALNAGTSNEGLADAIKELTTTLTTTQKAVVPTQAPMDTSGLLEGITGVNEKLADLVEKTVNGNTLLGRILEKQPIATGPSETTEKDAKEVKREKSTLISKLKKTNFRGMFNAGVDKLLAADPIILGTMLGGLAVTAITDPKSAALLAGGGLAVAAYTKYRAFSKAETAKEGDLYLNPGDEEPILEGAKLRNKDYLDMTTTKIIETWDDIKGSVKDITTGIVIGARKLADKLFTQDNKEVFLKGLNKVRELGMRFLKMVDPINRIKGMVSGVTDRMNKLDVYKEGDNSPTLIGKKFGTGAYFKRDESGNLVPLNGWKEIDGPVLDAKGEYLITQEDYDRGLKTSFGVSINKMGNLTSKFGKFGLNILGQAKDKALAGAGRAKDAIVDKFNDNKRIVSSIDRIYMLLAKQFGHSVDPSVITEYGDKAVSAITSKGKDKARKNSLADKADQERSKKEDKVKDSIIAIADSMTAEKKPDDNGKKRKGILGLLFGGLGALKEGAGALGELIFGKTIMTGFKSLFSFATMGLKVLPMMGASLAFIAKNLIGLFRGRGVGMNKDWGGNDVEIDPNDKKGKKKGKGKGKGSKAKAKGGKSFKLPGGRMGRLPGMGLMKGIGIGAGVSLATGALLDSGMVEEGGLAETALTAANYGGTAASVYSLASAGLGMAGTSVGAAVSGAGSLIGAGIGGLGTLLGGAAATAGAVLTSPITLTALAVGGLGYGIYKMYTRGKGKQLEIRMTQYGAHSEDDEFAQSLLRVEKMLTPHVIVQNGSAYFATTAPFGDAITALQAGGSDVGDLFSFLNGRFKPVFLTYMALLDAAGIKGMETFDKLTDRKAYEITKQSHETLMGMNPMPYGLQAKISKDYYTIPLDTTVTKITDDLSKLKGYTDRTNKDIVAEVEKQKSKINSVDDLERQKKELEDKKAKAGWFEKRKIQSDIDGIDEQISKLNTIYSPTKAVGRVNIDDLRGKDGAVEIFTQLRLYAYGDQEHNPDRVEAVLRLERSMEKFVTIQGGEPRFNGKTGEIYNEFKEAFGVTDKDSGEWCTWFRDRFLPVMLAYMTSMAKYRQGKPQNVWTTLSATAKYEIAKQIINTKVQPPDSKRVKTIWQIKASPFPGTKSNDVPHAARKLLQVLKEASEKAKIADPAGEAAKTSTLDNISANQGHAVGGGASDKRGLGDNSTGNLYRDALLRNEAGYQDYDRYKIKDDYVYKPMTGNKDLDTVDVSATRSNQGQDQGVSVPRAAAEQLIIKEMMAQGFTDPRQVAEMLALTNFESQGYARTTENMKYSDPKRMVKLFAEVKSEEQARQLIAQGPIAIANTVYGGGKGASLGNTEPGDGYRYRGRGFVQLTGKSNYARIGNQIGVDLVNNPELASTDPKVMAKIAVNFFKNSKQMQTISDPSVSFGYAANGLNGGNQLPDMDKRFSLYKEYLNKIETGKLSAEGDDPNAPDPTKSNTSSMNYNNSTVPSDSNGSIPGGTTNTGGYQGPLKSANQTDGYNGPSGEVSQFEKTAGVMNEAAGTRTSDVSGLKLKSPEAVAGGPAHPGVKRMGELIQQRVANFRYFSALNDAYHHKLSRGSAHKSGLAIDFTLTNGIGGSDAAMKVVTDIAKEGGLTPGKDYLLINEYRNASSGATGGHVHFGFKSEASADKFAKGAGVNLNNPEGGGSTDQGGEAMAPAVDAPATGYSTLPTANNDMSASTPSAPTSQMAPAVSQGPQVSQQPPAQPQTVNTTIDTDAMAKSIKQALGNNEAPAAQTALLKAILMELQTANKNSAGAKPSVKV